MKLNQSFPDEKSRLERRLSQIAEELSEWKHSDNQADLLECYQEFLKLKTVHRGLVVRLVERIEICEKGQAIDQQEVKVFWKFQGKEKGSFGKEICRRETAD